MDTDVWAIVTTTLIAPQKRSQGINSALAGWGPFRELSLLVPFSKWPYPGSISFNLEMPMLWELTSLKESQD